MYSEAKTLLASLDNLCQGLLYPSEADYPFHSFYWEITSQSGPLSIAQFLEKINQLHTSQGVQLHSVPDFCPSPFLIRTCNFR